MRKRRRCLFFCARMCNTEPAGSQDDPWQSYCFECYNVGNIKSAAEATGGVIGYMNARRIHSPTATARNITIKDVKETKGKPEADQSMGWRRCRCRWQQSRHYANCYSSGTIKNADVSGGVIQEIRSRYKDPTEKRISSSLSQRYDQAGIGDNKGQVKLISRCATGVSEYFERHVVCSEHLLYERRIPDFTATTAIRYCGGRIY